MNTVAKYRDNNNQLINNTKVSVTYKDYIQYPVESTYNTNVMYEIL